MIIFNILSVLLFLYLIMKSVNRIKQGTKRVARERMLIIIFIIHISVIVYLSFD